LEHLDFESPAQQDWRYFAVLCGIVIAMILAAPFLLVFALFDDSNRADQE
jgi:hypothetical protein